MQNLSNHIFANFEPFNPDYQISINTKGGDGQICNLSFSLLIQNKETFKLFLDIRESKVLQFLWYSTIYVVFVFWYQSFFHLTENENGPKTINEVKLINAGKILENNKTLAESRSPVSEIPGGVITMHVVARPPLADKNSGKYWCIV